MGLDGVELIMAVEDEFGLEIPEEDAQEFSTVGDLYDYLVARVGSQNAKRCLSSAAFYRLRRVLCAEAGAARRSVLPDTRLDGIIPWRHRRAVWRSVRRELGLKLPQLSAPWVLDIAQLCVVVGLGTLLVRCLIGWTPWWRLAELLAFGIALDLVTRPLFRRFPRRAYTVRDAVRYILARDGERLATETCAWRPEEVWTALQRVVRRQLAVPPEKVTREATWVEDLNVG
jgi:hypothetical protein